MSGPDDGDDDRSKDPYNTEVLLTMYEEVGEEYRLRHRLLHNVYYLFIIAIVLLAGSLSEVGQSGIITTNTLLIAAFPLFVLLGLVTTKHYVDRRSASAVRTRIEKIAEGGETVEADIPLGIQKHIVGRNSKLDESHNLVSAGRTWSVLCEKELKISARLLAQIMILLGVLCGLVGVLGIA